MIHVSPGRTAHNVIGHTFDVGGTRRRVLYQLVMQCRPIFDQEVVDRLLRPEMLGFRLFRSPAVVSSQASVSTESAPVQPSSTLLEKEQLTCRPSRARRYRFIVSLSGGMGK